MNALVETANWTDAQWSAFLDECFAQWLNKLDAIADYELRRTVPLKYWRELFDDGECERDAFRIVFAETQAGR